MYSMSMFHMFSPYFLFLLFDFYDGPSTKVAPGHVHHQIFSCSALSPVFAHKKNFCGDKFIFWLLFGFVFIWCIIVVSLLFKTIQLKQMEIVPYYIILTEKGALFAINDLIFYQCLT